MPDSDFVVELDWLLWDACRLFDLRRRAFQEHFGSATEGQITQISFLLETIRMDDEHEKAIRVELSPTLPRHRAEEILALLRDLEAGQEGDPKRQIMYFFHQKTMI